MMFSQSFDLNRGEISIRKIFWLLLAFEVVTMAVVLYGDLIVLAYYIGIVVTPLFLLLIPIEPTIGILLMVLATGLDFLARIKEGSETVRVNITYFHISLLVTLVSIFLNHIFRRRINLRSANLWPPFIMLIIVYSYSLIYTPAFIDGTVTFFGIIFMGLISLIVIESIDREWKLKLLMWGLIIIPLGISILTIYQLLTEGAFYSPTVVRMATTIGLAVYRSTGTFTNPNQLACFLMVGIVIPFGMLFRKKLNPLIKLVLIVSLIISSIGILSTFSRAGWLSTLAGLFLIVALHKKWSYFAIFLVILIVVTIALSIQIPQLWEVIIDRFESIFNPATDESSSSRISLIRSGIWMWQDHPIFGVGLSGFPYYYYDYIDPQMPYSLVNVNEAHTMQVEILAEEGLIGFVVATWLFMTIFFHGIRSIFRLENDFLKLCQITTTALFIGFIINFTFATDIGNNIFWITVGLLYAIPYLDKVNSSKNDLTGEKAAITY